MALKNGAVKSDLVDFDFADVKVSNTAFKPLVREAKFDVAELAIVTFLQAKVYGKPYVLIPATVLGRGQHHTIAYNPERGRLKASDLTGKRVGVRAYTQTTGAWVRGFLADDYGVDTAKVHWVTFEDPHLAEYKDPDFVTRAPEGKNADADAARRRDSMPPLSATNCQTRGWQAAYSRCRCGGAQVGANARRHADQSYDGGARHDC